MPIEDTVSATSHAMLVVAIVVPNLVCGNRNMFGYHLLILIEENDVD